MSILDILQRRGTIGSVVRWTYKHYHKLQEEGDNLPEDKEIILNYMFNVRYMALPPLSVEAGNRLEGMTEDKELKTLIDLCFAIYYIELNLSGLDFKLYTKTLVNANIVLKKLNIKNKTNYK